MTITKDKTKAINDLYIIQRYKYLKQVKGNTYTITAGKYINTKDGRKFKNKPLNDSLINRHLLGKESYGVFATHQTKFMLFDFDFADNFTLCKWYYYNVREALIEIGIAEQYIYAIFSGSKGLHLTIYFQEPISVKYAQDIYKRALQVADVQDMSKQIEFRPSNKQAVKLPLGLHFKTKKKSCFVNNIDVDDPLPDDTILNVNKIPIETIHSILDIEPSQYDKMNDDEIKQVAQNELYANVNELDIYKLGQDKEFTVSYYNDLYTNGLKARSTRHNTTLILAMFFKSYYKLERDEVFNILKEWLTKQDKSLYTSTIDEALKDTRQIVEDVFNKNYTLSIKQTDIHISVDELRTILTARNTNNKHFTHKQRLVLFALLVHSKRYTDDCQRIFYMSYQQMTKATGITNRRILQGIINQFEQVGLITVHRRNKTQEGTHLKLPNQYEVLFVDEQANACDEIDNSLIYDSGLFTVLINKHFTQSDLKKMLPRRQFEHYKVS